MKKNELTYKDLKNLCNPNILILKQQKNLEIMGWYMVKKEELQLCNLGLVLIKGYNFILKVLLVLVKQCIQNSIYRNCFKTKNT